MYASMMAALNPLGDGNKIPKELQIAAELHKKEVEELRKEQAAVVTSLEAQIKELKLTLGNQELALKDAQVTVQEQIAEGQKKQIEWDNVQKDLENKLRKCDEDRQKQKDAIELDSHLKLASAGSALEKVKIEHAKEIEKLKFQSETALQDIKYLPLQS